MNNTKKDINQATEILSVKNLSLAIDNIMILDDINFSAKAGEYISIIGQNGAGKSTLIKTIAGLYSNYSGNISILSEKVKFIKANEIGYVPQVKSLDRNFPAKLIELVASGITHTWNWKISKENKEKSIEILKKFNIEKLYNRNLNSLSGGELQRGYLARAIVGDPKLLLLDEPASGVDTSAESDLVLILEEYKNNNNIAIVAVTHDWNAAYHHSDKVLMLNVKQFCFDVPCIAFTDENLRKLYGHSNHEHKMQFGVEGLNND